MVGQASHGRMDESCMFGMNTSNKIRIQNLMEKNRDGFVSGS